MWTFFLSPLYVDALLNDNTITLAEEYRLDRSLSAEIETEREIEVLKLFCARLIDYSYAESVENAIKLFVEDVTSLKAHDFSVVNASEINMKGRSDNSIFFIISKKNTLSYVVKAFPNPCYHPSEYLAEISALNMIKNQPSTHIKPIKPLASAIYHENGQFWGLLLETAARGKRLDECLYPLSHPHQNLEDFELLEKSAIKAFSRLGESLAQLHKSPLIIGPMPKWNLVRYHEKITKALNDPFISQELSKHLNIPALVQYTVDLEQEILSLPILHTYLHGDANFGNMFYSEEEDLFYFIDTARLHHSIDRKGMPVLDGTLDLSRVEESLKVFVAKGMSPQTMNTLLTAFYSSYCKEGGQLPNEKCMHFYKVLMLMGRLLMYSSYVKRHEPHQKECEKNIFESAIKELQDIL